jgi:hypothetical protein
MTDPMDPDPQYWFKVNIKTIRNVVLYLVQVVFSMEMRHTQVERDVSNCRRC